AKGSRRGRKFREIQAGRVICLSDPHAPAQAWYDYPRCQLVAASADASWRAIANESIGGSRIVILHGGADQRRQPRKQPANVEDVLPLAFAPSEPVLAVAFANSVRRGHKAHIQHGVCLWHLERSREYRRFATRDRPGETAFSPNRRHI